MHGTERIPWYQRVPVSFVAAHDAVKLVEGLTADFQTRGLQIKESLGINATTGQIALAYKEEAQARLQQTAAAVAPLPDDPPPSVDQADNAFTGVRYHIGEGSTHNNQMFVAFAGVDARSNVLAGNVPQSFADVYVLQLATTMEQEDAARKRADPQAEFDTDIGLRRNARAGDGEGEVGTNTPPRSDADRPPVESGPMPAA